MRIHLILLAGLTLFGIQPEIEGKQRRKRDTNLLPSPEAKGIGQCGVVLDNRIFGGTETKIDEFPWMALLEYTFDNGKKILTCGGSLINDRYIVTAAHCIRSENPRLSGVRLGEWNIATEEDCLQDDCTDPPQDFSISEVVIHKDYQLANEQQYDDIALIRLSKPVTFTYFIRPVCLPLSSELRDNKNVTGVKFYVAGWGRTETRVRSDVKLKTAVVGVSEAQCSAVYLKARKKIIDKQLCAGGHSRNDSCTGDSGGPLMAIAVDKNKIPFLYLVGVVSYGPNQCGIRGWPGVYTRITSYLDWIESKIRP